MAKKPKPNQNQKKKKTPPSPKPLRQTPKPPPQQATAASPPSFSTNDDAASPQLSPSQSLPQKRTIWQRLFLTPTAWLLFLALGTGYLVGAYIPATWTVEQVALDVQEKKGKLYYTVEGKPVAIAKVFSDAASPLHPNKIRAHNQAGTKPALRQAFVKKDILEKGKPKSLYMLQKARRHWGWWSLLPALVAIMLCWITREPLTSLFGGVLAGAFLLGRYDITEAVLMPTMMTKNAASILLLYLWLLGGLLGIWSRTGAAQAFADFMARRFVRGPRSARLVAWGLGVLFFQGGTISTVLVGTTVKPLADSQNISHEELSYIVDSTASPIACLLAFNAWPGYVQAFIFVPGIAWLSTETLRVQFFFMAIPFSFYAIFAVLGTFLMCIDRAPFLGRRMHEAIRRARETGQLDAPDAQPLSAKELHTSHVPPGYTPHVIEFFLPFIVLTGVAIGTFVFLGTPQIRWAFGAAVAVAFVTTMLRGMSLRCLIEGFGDGLKGVVMGSVILVLAITIGGISSEAGGGIFLVELLGNSVPFWALPVILQILTIIIAFSTGTSWGTYAVTFPLAMPLAFAVAQSQGLAHPQFFVILCFAAVMNGSVFGDQCSPISDTTVLSSMCTGCDLMDHVRTQLPQASAAAVLAGIAWTVCAFFAA